MIMFDTFLPFFGVVEDLDDPEQIGRVRVRCFGYHTQNKSFIPTDYLRWFSAVVSNSSGTSGIGHSPTGYVKGSTVFGYFLNREMQDGIVLGSITGQPTAHSLRNVGFNDPDGIYPIHINEPDINRLARGVSSHWIFNARAKAQVKQIQKPLAKGEYSEPSYDNKSVYPNNDVLETTSGHVREYDNTKDQERVHEYHRTGTYYEIDKEGNRVVKVVGDGYEIIAGNKFMNVRGTVNMTIEGDVNQYVKGDYNIQIDGNKNQVVMGDSKEFVSGEKSTLASSGYALDAALINLNSGLASGNSSIPITLPKEYAVEFVLPLIKVSGRFAALDEPIEINSTPTDYPPDNKPSSYTEEPKLSDKITTPKTTMPPKCTTDISNGLKYTTQLGTSGFSIADLSRNALFSHSITSQNGLSEQDIVCNLEALATNILKPLKEEFGSFRINSGFRVGSSRSQHNKGQAVDIQEPSWSYNKYLEVAEWIADNLAPDQLIIEHGNSIWIHVSYNGSSNTQRGQLLTMLEGKYENGLKLYYS